MAFSRVTLVNRIRRLLDDNPYVDVCTEAMGPIHPLAWLFVKPRREMKGCARRRNHLQPPCWR